MRRKKVPNEKRCLNVYDVIRMRDYHTMTGYRVWMVIGCYLGGLGQESTYELYPLDVSNNGPIRVPQIMIATNNDIELMTDYKSDTSVRSA